MKVLIICALLAAFCCVVFGDEVKCALAAISCVPKYSGSISSNSSCTELEPLGKCLFDGDCGKDDFTYKAQETAYGFKECNFSGAGAVFFSFSLIVAMVSFVQFLTR